jgi:hypothetical protein
MASGNVTLQANVSGGNAGSQTFGPLTVTATSAVPDQQPVALSSGNNTVTLPASITALVIVPPNAANPTPNPPFAGTLTLKGASGDTGIVLSNKNPQMLTWDSAVASPASIVINSSVSCTVTIWTM